MFTGLVQAVGTLVSREKLPAGERFVVSHALGLLTLGESVAVSGACLTVTSFDDAHFTVDLSPETLRRTTLGELGPEAKVNLERALTVGDRLGGHLVSGHVDGVGTVRSVETLGEMTEVAVDLGAALSRYAPEKGSVTIDGVSLTINRISGSEVTLLLIPHTRSATTLGALEPGTRVNVEVDQVARYVERLLEAQAR